MPHTRILCPQLFLCYNKTRLNKLSTQELNINFIPGQRIRHPEFGQGFVIRDSGNGFIQAVFPSVGERQVPLSSLESVLSREEQMLAAVEGSEERLRHVFLAYESHAIPLLESSAALTSARIDLLPHQIVLTHHVATASPRRFLVADEVGLGKTIEIALILRELASRGELKRAIMVVPAGLVNNWHSELNELFNLNFEIFGSEGDITDRRSNAFAKHNRLIASIDTLKRPERIKRIQQAPPWDLVVFDEAHHLTAYKSGSRVKKTKNYKLAEALKKHCRDLILLSATPHQGDNFRFWMLVQLLNPAMFKGPEDMVENRHRLNALVFRRTKADACKPDGSPLFSRRWVHTESFIMSESEREFYAQLRQYLQDGFALAKRKGNKGRALGFVMTIFQKIAASSFAAVRRTLRRRLLMLTIHEAILKDEALEIDAREDLYEKARILIHEEFNISNDHIGCGETDRILADIRIKLLRKLSDEELFLASDSNAGEQTAIMGEDMAVMPVGLALPEERLRISDLLQEFPEHRETKMEKLLRGLGTLWHENPREKVVIFATYLGTVELIGREIDTAYPGQGVVVLKGGDHGSKLAAERRFKSENGPRILVCTAAGREGINLQFARILFNFDLPWNPMDVEQRIGRIHRYGQHYTAQVYNLVLSDTIEGKIFLLLDDKLNEIARTLGKIDEHGNIAEDLRSQILGQLSERIKYDTLYQEALSDPELHRTRLELEAALSNADQARKVVFELFQDLDEFSLEDFKPFANIEAGIERLIHFLQTSLKDTHKIVNIKQNIYEIRDNENRLIQQFTTDRDTSRQTENLDLLGLDHPLIIENMQKWKELTPEQLGVSVKGKSDQTMILTWWFIETVKGKGERQSFFIPLAVDKQGTRIPAVERNGETFLHASPAKPKLNTQVRMNIYQQNLEPMLHRELKYRNFIKDKGGFSAKLVCWLEIG